MRYSKTLIVQFAARSKYLSKIRISVTLPKPLPPTNPSGRCLAVCQMKS